MLKNLKIWQKLSLIVVAFSVPIGVLLHYLVTEQNIILDFARNELDGTQYLRPVRKLFADICEHRTMAASVLSGGDAVARDKLQAKQAEINADFAAVEQAEQRYSYKYKSEKPLAAVKAYWEELQKRSFNSTPEASYEQHRKLMTLMTNLIIVVGNDSELILDPDVDSYYSMDAVIFKIPALVNQVSQMQAVAIGRGNADARRAQLSALQAVTEESLAGMEGNLAYGLAANSDMEARLKPLVGYVENATRDFVDAVNSGGNYNSAGMKAVESSFTLYDSTMPMLDSLLTARIDHNAHRRTLSMVGAALAVALSILLTVVIVRSITQPVHRLSQAAERISMGEMGVEVEIRSNDEIGELSERFRRMQESLKVAMSQLGV